MATTDTPSDDLASALGVPHLRLSKDGAKIDMGTSGVAAVYGPVTLLEAMGHTVTFTDGHDATKGTAMYRVADAVDPHRKVYDMDPGSGLMYYAGAYPFPAPEPSAVVHPAGAPGDDGAKRVVAQVRKFVGNRKRPKPRHNDLVLDDELQAEVDSGRTTHDVAQALQRDRNKDAKAELAARLANAGVERETAENGKTLGRGQSDVARVNRELAEGGELIAPAKYMGLAYPWEIGGFVGPSGCGKSWATLAMCHQSLNWGESVMVLDYEDRDVNVVRRMRALGAHKALEDGRFVYVAPEVENGTVADLDLILDTWTPEGTEDEPGHFGVIVVDGVTKALGAAGVDDNSGTAYARWEQANLRPLAQTGAAVVTVDHTGKGADLKVGEAIGSMQKKGQVTGAMFSVKPIQPPRPGGLGKFALYMTKDRQGDVAQRVRESDNFAGIMEVDSRPAAERPPSILLHRPDTEVRFIPYNPETDNGVNRADLMPAVDAALHDVFPEDETRHRVKGKWSAKLPNLGEIMWVVVSAVVGSEDGARGLTKPEVFKYLKEMAPEAVGNTKDSRLEERLETQVKKGHLRLSGARYLPADDLQPSARKVQDVLDSAREHMAALEELDDDGSPDDVPDAPETTPETTPGDDTSGE